MHALEEDGNALESVSREQSALKNPFSIPGSPSLTNRIRFCRLLMNYTTVQYNHSLRPVWLKLIRPKANSFVLGAAIKSLFPQLRVGRRASDYAISPTAYEWIFQLGF